MPQEYGSEARSSALPCVPVRMTEPLFSACPLRGKKRRPPVVSCPAIFASRVFTVLGASFLCLSAAANAQTSRSLPETMEKSVLTHPEVQARFHDFLSTLEGQNIQRGGLRPQVSAEGWTGKKWRTGGTDPSTNWSRSGYSLQLRQLLFDGFQTINTVRQHGFEKLAAY